MTDLYAGQRYNFVSETEHPHPRAEVGEWDAIAVTVPEDVSVDAGEFVYIGGFFGVALQESEEGSEDEIGIQMKPAEYETDQIDVGDDFVKGTNIFFDPVNREFSESDWNWESAAHATGSTMEANIEGALEDLGFDADLFTVSDEGDEEFHITFDVEAGITRLGVNLDSLSGTGEVSYEKTQDCNFDDEGEVWEIDIDNASGGSLDIGVEGLWAGLVSVEKDDDDIVWFLLPAFNYQPTTDEGDLTLE